MGLISKVLQKSKVPLVTQKKRLLIIGSGWGGYRVLQTVERRLFDVIMVSPRNYFLMTPLLVPACTGILSSKLIVEPIRHKSLCHESKVRFYEATIDSIDMKSKKVRCSPEGSEPFSLEFDKLVIACGAVPNTFNIPGVTEYAHFFKDIQHAERVRNSVINCLEEASMPCTSVEKAKQLLHFVCVGGGPTGIELVLEIDRLISNVIDGYPGLKSHVKMTILDVAPSILGSSSPGMIKSITKRLDENGIHVVTGRSVKLVDTTRLVLDNDENLDYGILIWTTGVKPGPLIDTITSAAKDRSGRLLVDERFRVIDLNNNPMNDDIYAIGDCATPRDVLPCTAQVANQQGKYLGHLLNKVERLDCDVSEVPPFKYVHKGTIVYTGGLSAVVELSIGNRVRRVSGMLGGILWQIIYWMELTGWRNRLIIPWYLLCTWLFGRDGGRFK